MGYLDNIIEAFNEDILHTNIDISIDNFNYSVNNIKGITEAEYNKKVDHLKLDILDIEKFVKRNNLKPVTNPVLLDRNYQPTEDGLLSNEIFGTTVEDRAGYFAYIDLGDWYIDPSCYKCWTRIDRCVKDVIHKNGKFRVNAKGEIVPDENGKNGIKFLKDNIDKIKFKTSDSRARDLRIKYLNRNRLKMFIHKYPVIPPYYRDVDTGKKAIGVGGINRLYQNLLRSIAAINQTQEYGFDMSGSMIGQIQETLLAIYDYACGTNNKNIEELRDGNGISGKLGILRRANMSKTSNYAARLVISSPNLKTNTPDDMMVKMDTSAIPLGACIACFRPFVQFNIRKFFENEFIGTELYPAIDESGKVQYIRLKDPLMTFSDEMIMNQMDQYITAANNRFVPIELPTEDGKKLYMQLKKKTTLDGPVSSRRFTWTDLFFIACKEAVKDKMALIVRYPVDTRYNTIATKLEVSSTNDTESVYVNNVYYRWYPKIEEKDMYKDTNADFVDTMKISNLYLAGMGGDYDGDTVSVKGVFTDEANQELKEFYYDKKNFIDLGGNIVRSGSGDNLQSLYVITKVLDPKELKDPVFN